MAKKTHCEVCGTKLEPFADEPRVDHCPVCCPGTQADHFARVKKAGEDAWGQYREQLPVGQVVPPEQFHAARSAGTEDQPQ